MAIDYVGKWDTFATILRSHNTTTASPDLSASLTTRVQNIFQDDIKNSGIRIDRGPAIFINLNRASEEETQIGNFTNRRKFKTMTYDIYGAIKKTGASQSYAASLDEFYQLADNVEAVIKRESNLSGTALHVNLVETDFLQQPENNFWKVFKTTVEVRYIYS